MDMFRVISNLATKLPANLLEMDKVEVNVASPIWQELLHVFCWHGFLAAWKLDLPRTTLLSD